MEIDSHHVKKNVLFNQMLTEEVNLREKLSAF